MKWKVFNCCFYMPHRYYICIVAFFDLTISYIMRFNLSITMTEMADKPFSPVDPDACLHLILKNKTTHKKLEFEWTERQQGLVHSSFFWGYIVTQVPGGMLAERIGPKIVLTVFMGLTSVCCGMTPIVARAMDFQGLICLRVLLGLCEGFVYAALHLVVASWVPKQERGTWGTVIFAGAHAGNTFNNLFSGLMLYWFPGNWPIVFYVWAIIGASWTVVWALTTYNFPTDYEKMKPKEKQILDDYLESVGKKENGFVNAFVFAVTWTVSIFAGVLVDFIQKKNILKTVSSRKLFTTIASVGPSLGLLGAAYSGCSIVLAVGSLTLGMCTLGFFYPSLKVNPIDLAPNYAGTLGALVHTLGALSGVIVPYLIGRLNQHSYLAEWRLLFWITFGVMSITNVFYVLFASADLQSWNKVQEEEGTEINQ